MDRRSPQRGYVGHRRRVSSLDECLQEGRASRQHTCGSRRELDTAIHPCFNLRAHVSPAPHIDQLLSGRHTSATARCVSHQTRRRQTSPLDTRNAADGCSMPTGGRPMNQWPQQALQQKDAISPGRRHAWAHCIRATQPSIGPPGVSNQYRQFAPLKAESGTTSAYW
jgi:hypothetical protein